MPDCVACKGRGWCGKPCPIFERMRSMEDTVRKVRGKELFGSSPPSVFVGAFGWPNLRAGVLVPPIEGKTGYLDNPELWASRGDSIPEIIRYRSELVNSQFDVHARRGSRFLEAAQEVAMASRPVDTEVLLKDRPYYQMRYDARAMPMGPRGEVVKVDVTENPSVDRKIEYLVGDTDVKASVAIEEMYQAGTRVNDIQRLLSIGLLGQASSRRLVPTRWSITAVDDGLGKNVIEKVKGYREIDKVRVFTHNYLGNYFAIVLLPRAWNFELLEAHLPGSVWVPGKDPVMAHDWEGHFGRKRYASSTAGAYYAARLAALEYLERIKRQASCLILREVREEYYAPLGVWVIRENVRDCFEQGEECETLDGALLRVSKCLSFSPARLKSMSYTIKEYNKQKRIKDFI